MGRGSGSKSPLLGIVLQNPYEMGYTAVKTIVDIVEGRKVEETIVVPGSCITPEEADLSRESAAPAIPGTAAQNQRCKQNVFMLIGIKPIFLT